MSETPSQTPGVPQVQDRRLKIPGVVPKNAQARILGGIALLMVVIIALSGKNPAKERTAAAPRAGGSVIDPNQTRIQEYRSRIEEQAAKLAAEEAQLTRTKQALLGAAPAPQGSSGRAMAPMPSSRFYGPRDQQAPEDPLALEEETNQRRSLHASNIALSYRLALVAPVERGLPVKSAADALRTETATPAAVAARDGVAPTAERHPTSAQPQAQGPLYRVFEGTVIETVLTNRLDGSFSGPVNCMATTNVYSHDGQHVLIPQGTRILGEVRKLETFGQQRLAVVFHRLIMPDGYTVSLDKFQGLSQVGETGLQDQINHHYLQIFGVSLAIGAIAGLSQANTRYGLDTSAADAYRQGVATSVSQSSLHILDRYLNVLPTFTIREGHRVKVYLSEDLLVPAYDRHEMTKDL